MIATNFEFNGIQCKDVGLAVVSFGSDIQGVADYSGSEIVFNTSKPANGSKLNFHGSKYDSQLSFTFKVAKIDLCKPSPTPIKAYEKAYYKKWLERRDGYKFLRFFQDGFENIYFNVRNTLKWIEYGGKTYGMEITVTCDAPFGYSTLQSYETRVSAGGSFQIYNDSDEIGAIIPQQIEIKILSDGTLRLQNNMSRLYQVNYQDLSDDMVIKNCKVNEVIIINGITKQIKSSLSAHDIVNDFNWVYPKLVNIDEFYPVSFTLTKQTLLDRRTNIFNVTGCSANISLAYRTIRLAVM